MNDTIASIASANEFGAISIVRVCGQKALEVGQKITRKNHLTPRYAHLCKLFSDDGAIIDEAIVIYFKAPKSYTGEDIVEFQTHGGVSVAKCVLDEILKHDGLRLARAGEFSKRAVINGKLSIDKAEAINALISTKNKASVKILARQLSGELERLASEIRQEILRMIAHAETVIDYAQEDLDPNIEQNMLISLDGIAQNLQTLYDKSIKRGDLLNGFRLAIIGKPNVGKSSILNALLDYERAIVSNTAGTTRDFIEGELMVGENLVKIVDTAGIRSSNEHIEKQGIINAKDVAQKADAIMAIFDYSKALDEDDEKILTLCANTDTKILIVLNKIDLPQGVDLSRFANLDLVRVSAKNDISSLQKAIAKLTKTNINADEIILTSKRQFAIIYEAISQAIQAKDHLKDGALELFSFHANSCIEEISKITKPFDYSEVLDTIFDEFCLGK